MALHVDFRTPRQICYAMERVSRSKIDTLVARPWNMYEPDTTTWWLVPSSDWPAYKYGKFHFDWGNREHTSIFTSLYFEKGLDQVVSSVYSCPKGLRHIMNRDWTWHRLIRDLENGQIPKKIICLAKELPIPVELRIDGGYVQDPCDFDPNAPGFSWDTYYFYLDAQTKEFNLRWSKTDAELLTSLSALKTFDELSGLLRKFNSNAWVWVNFHLGISLQIQGKSSAGQETIAWNTLDLWENFFQYLSPWLI